MEGSAAAVDCGVGFPYSLAAGGTLVCTYGASLPDASDRVNTATATLQNYAYAPDGSATPGGSSGFSGGANVSFNGTAPGKSPSAPRSPTSLSRSAWSAPATRPKPSARAASATLPAAPTAWITRPRLSPPTPAPPTATASASGARALRQRLHPDPGLLEDPFQLRPGPLRRYLGLDRREHAVLFQRPELLSGAVDGAQGRRLLRSGPPVYRRQAQRPQRRVQHARGQRSHGLGGTFLRQLRPVQHGQQERAQPGRQPRDPARQLQQRPGRPRPLRGRSPRLNEEARQQRCWRASSCLCHRNQARPRSRSAARRSAPSWLRCSASCCIRWCSTHSGVTS